MTAEKKRATVESMRAKTNNERIAQIKAVVALVVVGSLLAAGQTIDYMTPNGWF